MLKYITLFLTMLCAANAQSITFSGNRTAPSANATATYTITSIDKLNATQLRLNFTVEWDPNTTSDRPNVTVSSIHGSHGVHSYTNAAPASGTTLKSQVITASTTPTTFTLSGAIWKAFTGNQFAPAVTTTFTASTSLGYKAVINIPANTGTLKRTFFFIQNGEQVGVTQQDAGAAARTVTLLDLETNDPVILEELTGGFIGGWWTGTELTIEKIDRTVTNVLSTNTTTVQNYGDTGSPSFAPTGGSPTPVNPTTPADAPDFTDQPLIPVPTTAPTPQAPTTAPDAPTPGADATEATNNAAAATVGALAKVIEATDKVASAVTDAATKGIEGTDKVATAVWESGGKGIEATDKVATAVWESGTKTLEGLDKLNANTEVVAGAVGGLGTKLDSANQSLDVIEQQSQQQIDDRTALNSAASSGAASSGFVSTATGQGNSANTTAWGSAPTLTGTAAAATSSAANPGADGGFRQSVDVAGTTVYFSLLPSDMGSGSVGATILANCRGVILLAMVLGFFRSISGTVTAYASSAPGSVGINNVVTAEQLVPVGGWVAVGIKRLASATAITALLVGAMATILITANTMASGYGMGVLDIFDAFDLTALGGGIKWLDTYFPVFECITLQIMAIGFPYVIAPIYAFAVSLSRWLNL